LVVIEGKCEILVLLKWVDLAAGNALFLRAGGVTDPARAVASNDPDQGLPVCFLGTAEEDLVVPTVESPPTLIQCNLRPQTPPFEPIWKTSGISLPDTAPAKLFTFKPESNTTHRITVEGNARNSDGNVFSFGITVTFKVIDNEGIGEITKVGQPVQHCWHSDADGFGVDVILDDSYGSGDQRLCIIVTWPSTGAVWTWRWRDLWGLYLSVD
jgi:hypothetical protein